MSLPSGGTTNFFRDLIDNIYGAFERDAANVVDNIHRELVDASPVYTGTLASNWKKGISPHSKSDNKRPKDLRKYTYQPASTSNVKTYGVHKSYYVWNNTPYLVHVNSGYFANGNHKGFVGKAIAIGEAKASGKI